MPLIPVLATAPPSVTPTLSMRAMNAANQAESFVARSTPMLMSYATRLVGVVIILIAAWFLSKWLCGVLGRVLNRATADITLNKFLSNLTRWVVLILALVTCLALFGVNITAFATVLGAAGLTVGLALQGSLSNLAAGVMLLLFRPFKVGDIINVSGQTGKVDEIELFTTKIDTFDNRRVILPNAAVFGATIENRSFHATRRTEITVGTSYGADIDHTRSVLESAARAVPNVLADPAPLVTLVGLGASSIDWTVFVWSATSDMDAVKQSLIREVKNRLDEAGIEIPFPHVQLIMPSAPAPSPQSI